MTDTVRAIAALPFTEAIADQETRLWAVCPTGDWAADNRTGADHAEALIACMTEYYLPGLLGQVVKAMSGCPWTGAEVGFFQRIAERLDG